jgi:hypothetical protein
MIQIDTELCNVREVDGHELRELCSGENYRLVCIVQEQSLTAEEERMPCPGPTQDQPCSHNVYWGSRCYTEVIFPKMGHRTTTRYVIGQARDDAMAELTATVAQLRQDLHDENQERAQAARERKEAVEALEVITKERDQLQARVEELDKALTDSRVKARESSKEVSQLTANIERLSTEFGAREVRRVLSS